MNSQTAWQWCKGVALAAALTGGGAATAQPQVQPESGPGMMGGSGMGQGMMGGSGHGYGMGPGMMGGYGMGPGMMHGGGCPMAGLGPLWQLNLNADQRKKIDSLMSQQREQHWSIMRSMSDQYAKLRSLYSAENLDANAIGKVYDEIFKNQRAMIDSSIKARNQIYGILTPEQRTQLRQYGGGWGPGPGPAPGR